MLQVREENVDLLLNVGRKLVTDGTEKTGVSDAFFASVFTKKVASRCLAVILTKKVETVGLVCLE